MNNTITLHNTILHSLTLTDNRPIAGTENLFSARDVDGMLRVHNGRIFLGYTRVGKNRNNEWRFGFYAWNDRRFSRDYKTLRRRTAYKSMLGAERGLTRAVIKLNEAVLVDYRR